MKKITKLWPIFLLALVYGLSYFNTDYMLIPALVQTGLPRGTILVIVCSFSFLDMLGGYIGWSGLRSLVEKLLKDDIDFLKKLKGEQKTKDFIEWLQIYFTRKYLLFLNNGNGSYKIPISKKWLFNHFDTIFKWAVITVKGGGYLTMFFFGLSPIPGSRMIPDILCGTARWRNGFIVLAISNFLRISTFVYGWSWLLS
ncbi:MAG: hypothetical protein Q8R55_02680 [Candidatus Taylorbacteria bacterium]|nr:hypothetical protein [Candidatus Taylorbacteria bacterium]